MMVLSLTGVFRDLSEYLPNLESVSVVPVGLSKYREVLYPLEPFTKEDAQDGAAYHSPLAE